MWKYIIANKPEVWVWLGDNIYANTRNMDEMARMYQRQLQNRNYKKLLAACKVVGIWDDHDYGANDVGKNYPEKETSQQLMLDFIGEPQNTVRRQQKGVYTTYDYGTTGEKLKLILLDTRYHRDNPGSDADMLGEEQWKWLENTLNTDDADVTIIGSGIQFASGPTFFEGWLNFPKSLERLKKMIANSKKKHIIFISGDRHLSEICRTDNLPSYPIYDFTSSGLTHSNFFMKNSYENSNRISPLNVKKNFGIIKIDWTLKKLILESRGKNNQLFFSKEIGFGEIE